MPPESLLDKAMCKYGGRIGLWGFAAKAFGGTAFCRLGILGYPV